MHVYRHSSRFRLGIAARRPYRAVSILHQVVVWALEMIFARSAARVMSAPSTVHHFYASATHRTKVSVLGA